jgi:hypothetical protein
MSAIDFAGAQPAPVTPHPVSAPDSAIHAGARVPTRTPARVRERLGADLTPPQLWSEPVPQLRATWDYAAKGEQCPEEGIARAGARAYAAVTLPVRFGLLSVDWLIQRPARLIAAIVLYAVAVHVPMLGFLPFWF